MVNIAVARRKLRNAFRIIVADICGCKDNDFCANDKKSTRKFAFSTKSSYLCSKLFGQLKSKKDYNDEGNSEKGRKSEKDEKLYLDNIYEEIAYDRFSLEKWSPLASKIVVKKINIIQ